MPDEDLHYGCVNQMDILECGDICIPSIRSQPSCPLSPPRLCPARDADRRSHSSSRTAFSQPTLPLDRLCRYPERDDEDGFQTACQLADACRGGEGLESSIVSCASEAAVSVLVINFISCLMWQAIRCTHPNCSCDCFAPGRGSKRTCSTCHHGWISHGE